MGHGRAHLVRAVMEGVCFAMRDSLVLMHELQGPFSEARAVGGGSRGHLWRQLQADIYGLPVVTMGPASGPPYGAAAMAAVGAGDLASIAETADSWLHVEETVEPEPGRVELYSELYNAYRELYPALKRRFADTAALMERLSR
jgi:xylulokinase